MLMFARSRTTPILVKGSTYDGIKADALAAPYICWDGTRFVMTVSAWNIATSKWYSLFFTSSNMQTWSYVAGSLRVPPGSDYILGNAGIAWFNNKYWHAYNHYPVGGGPNGPAVTIAWSTDLITWVIAVDPIPVTGVDPGLVVNPHSGLLELWWVGLYTRNVFMHDSPDGLSWTSHGLQFSSPVWNGNSSIFGEAHAFYPSDGSRWLVCDVASSDPGGGRLRALFKSANRDTNYTSEGSCLGANPLNSWESVQVFDGHVVGSFDIGNGLGEKLWLVYAGSDNANPTDDTNSSIGIAWMDGFASSPPPPPSSSSFLPLINGGLINNFNKGLLS